MILRPGKWNLHRRDLLRGAAVAAAAPLVGSSCAPQEQAEEGSEDLFSHLKPMTDGVNPISDEERLARMEKARRLMAENQIDAIVLESGSSMTYYAGTGWGRSERMFAMILPVKGELGWVVPGFEEARAREVIRFGDDIRVWEEDENPAQRVAEILKDRNASTKRVGFEETVRFFVFDEIRKAAPAIDYVSATPVTAGCRMIKSPAELALMQRANDITIEAFKATAATIHEGMTPAEFRRNCSAAHQALGVRGSASVNFGAASAFPHGSRQPQRLAEGDILLFDGGCTVEDYRSDISRTMVLGTPSDRQREIWNLELEAQNAGFAAAKPGEPCEAVDAAARKVITDAGFGPDYKIPGLPHRTGHGIGMDTHEWTNFVRGNKTPMQPGMCFSDEPMIAIYGEFGVRLEDCLYITEDGAQFFSKQSVSIEEPFG